MARIEPLWLLPRSTLGAPRMVGRPQETAARAVSSVIGNSLIATPRLRMVAMRWIESSSWLAVGMPRPRACASRVSTRCTAPSLARVLAWAASSACSRLMAWLPIMYCRYDSSVLNWPWPGEWSITDSRSTAPSSINCCSTGTEVASVTS